jgi:serine/threonine protein kinase
MISRYHRLPGRLGAGLAVLSFTVADDSAFRERFRREQRVMAAFEHPNVCPIYEAGEVDGRLFLVMRLVRGPTLKDLIIAGELDPRRPAPIIAQTADALDTTHEAGLSTATSSRRTC